MNQVTKMLKRTLNDSDGIWIPVNYHWDVFQGVNSLVHVYLMLMFECICTIFPLPWIARLLYNLVYHEIKRITFIKIRKTKRAKPLLSIRGHPNIGWIVLNLKHRSAGYALYRCEKLSSIKHSLNCWEMKQNQVIYNNRVLDENIRSSEEVVRMRKQWLVKIYPFQNHPT